MTATNVDQVIAHVKEHLEIIPTWLDKCKIDLSIHAHICSAGPSLEKYVEQVHLKEEAEDFPNKNKVWAVKHSLRRLVDVGITPDYCVILDGRPVAEKSTHGFNRLDLIKDAPKSTVFFIASMADPAYTHYLLENGYKVIGWHCLTEGLKGFGDKIKYAVSGGTSSTIRSLGIAHTLGFRKATLYGVDSSFPDVLEPHKRPHGYIETFIGSKTDDSKVGPIATTGELAAQALDIERAIIDEGGDIEFEVKCDGLVGEVVKKRENKTLKKPYKEVLGIH